MKNILPLYVFAFVSLVGFVDAQSEKTGKLKGMIIDQNDAVVLPAKITVTNKGRRWV